MRRLTLMGKLFKSLETLYSGKMQPLINQALFGGSMTRYILVFFGILITAMAQVLLKRSSGIQTWSRIWFIFLILSLFLYVVSLCIYFYILKLFPLSKIYPVMTISVILLITGYGFFNGENITFRHLIGLILGMGSVYFIFSGMV
jgi:drug/metabolite transporter (DMT)-like permease